LAALTAFGVEISANAQLPVCEPGIPDLSGCCFTKPNPVFVAGTSAAKSALQAVAKALPGITIVYQTPDSCVGLAALTANAATGGGNVTTNILGADGSVAPCALSPGFLSDPEEAVNIAVSDIFPATCQANVGSGGITAGKQVDVLGPIQAQTIVVPSAASPDSISAEAAQVVFRFDATKFVLPPWTEPASVFIRPFTSGTLNIIGTAIGLPGAKWANATNSASPLVEPSSAAMYAAVANASSGPDASSPVDSTIGILAAQFVQQSNATVVLDGGGGGTVKALAFQQRGQSCGYYPDSVASSGDKLNVRQGRYAIWGPAHLVANVGATGNPTGLHAAAVAAVLNAGRSVGHAGRRVLRELAGLPGWRLHPMLPHVRTLRRERLANVRLERELGSSRGLRPGRDMRDGDRHVQRVRLWPEPTTMFSRQRLFSDMRSRRAMGSGRRVRGGRHLRRGQLHGRLRARDQLL
jgi:hypothetical protein